MLLLASPAANADDSLEAKRLVRAAIYEHALAYVDRALAANASDPQLRMLKVGSLPSWAGPGKRLTRSRSWLGIIRSLPSRTTIWR